MPWEWKDAAQRLIRGAAAGATPRRSPRPRLLLCEPSLTSSPGRVPPPGGVTDRREPCRLGAKRGAGAFGSRPRLTYGRLLLQQEGHLHIDLVAGDVAVLDQDVLVLDPRPFDAPQRLGGASDRLCDGVVKARLRRG